MEDQTESNSPRSTVVSEYFDKIVRCKELTSSNCVTVKFTAQDGNIFTQSYSEKATIGEIKSILVDVFAISASHIDIKQGDASLDNDKRLNEFKMGPYNTLEFCLFSTHLGRTISAKRAYEDFALPDVITVRVDDSDVEDGYRDVVVEIVDRAIKKPFVGGFFNKESGVEYHHGYSQTGPAPQKVPPERKTHRDTQTYFWRNRLVETQYARATQMAREDVYIPNVTDKILTAGPYETAEQREIRLAKDDKVRTIQRYFRAWKIRQALKLLSAEYKKRVRIENELEEWYSKDNDRRKRVEMISKVFPRTKADFCMLFAMVDRWKKAEIKRICNTFSGPAKITAFYMLLDKEVQMLRAIENHREQVKREMKIEKDREFFRTISDPIGWNMQYKNWMHESKDLYLEMDTLETQQGQAYLKIFESLSDDQLENEDKLQALLNVKLLFEGHNCQTSIELVSLVERACELIVRGFSKKQLTILMKRIRSLLIKHVQIPECSFGVTNRMNRVREKLMTNNLFYCKRCKKVKTHQGFVVDIHTEKVSVCQACAWDDRVMEPWFDIAPYRYILRLIRREERTQQSPSSIAFIVQDKDIHHIIVNIWHGHSAISEDKDVYNFRLCRWFKDLDWAPWNCVLLTNEEAKAHLTVRKLEEVYDKQFLDRVFNKQSLAKLYFKKVLKLEDHFQQFGEFDTKWNEIRQFTKFVAVNSKTKISYH